MYRHAALSSLLSLLVLDALAQESIQTTSGQFKTSFETLELPGGEPMGFLGGQFLYEVAPNLSIGPAAYGALTGERGGFITLGGALDFSYPLTDNWLANAGYFLGAGGGRGGYALSGGGLQQRAHLGLEYDLGDYGRLGIGISNQDFPNGTINSTQPYLTYSYPFSTLINDGWRSAGYSSASSAALPESEQDFSIVARHYEIPSSVTRDNGATQHPRIELVGAEWTNYLDQSRFIRLESEGAMGGRSNGYMQILVGAGYRMPITEATSLKGALSLGVAGGGGVDTGGGLLLDAQATVQHMLTESLFVEFGAGYVMAPQASFEALSVLGKIGYKFGTPTVGAHSVSVADLAGYTNQPLRIRAVNQTYQQAAPAWRTFSVDKDVNNLGVQLDYFPSEYLYLTGQGIAAYQGDAGAYMAGLVGAGVHVPLGQSPFYVEAEALAGAAGGGGLAVGGGLVWQTNAQVGYEFTDSLSFTLGAGRLEAVDGPIKANVISAGLAYKFGVPIRARDSGLGSLHKSGGSFKYADDSAMQARITATAIDKVAQRYSLRVDNPLRSYWPEALANTHAAVSGDVPDDIRTLEYEVVEDGHSVHLLRLRPDVEFDVSDIRDAKILPPRDITYDTPLVDDKSTVTLGLANRVWFDDTAGDSGLDTDLTLDASLALSEGVSLKSQLRVPVYTGSEGMRAVNSSSLPTARSANFGQPTSGLNLETLYLENRGTANRFLHHRERLGLLEGDYAGVGGEWLYWPYQSRLAAGFSAAYVKQRSANSPFELADYSVATGHASLYWATPFFNIDSALHLGRYLAGDWGGTLELRRTLSNGWQYGVWGSYTEASEGGSGLDNTEHGLFLRMPFDVSGGRHWVQTQYDVALQSAPRDAGARLEALGSSIWWDLREARFDVFRGY